MKQNDYQIVATELAFPEGPVVMPDGSVIVVEIATGAVTRIAQDGQALDYDGGGSNGSTLIPVRFPRSTLIRTRRS